MALKSPLPSNQPFMPALAKDLRRQLENAIKDARRVAEAGARAALDVLALSETRVPPHLEEAAKQSRRRLRAHGMQLGDHQVSEREWDIHHLVIECAYEHWHRMLFARFLAENGFLIEPDSDLDVDFQHCEEEGKRLGIDPWELASGFAQKMLLDVFRTDDPVLQVRLPAESRNQLTALLTSLPREIFLASDSLGWVYQFWQAKKKDEVNASGNKIGADELPAVTQLFTEDYMVDFLLDNTLGAWHAGKILAANPTLAESVNSEDELRKAVALPGVEWKYLRFIKGKDRRWTPAAGRFDGWPKTAKELKCLDPCMGSGHFVVAMFRRLVALRMAEEGLDEKAAVAEVIRHNLFGLEIDPRCTQIGAFNLVLAAWRRVGYCPLPAMNLACSGLAPNTREADWLKLAGDNEKLQRGMARLYQLFQKAAVLGSLINPRAGEGDLLVAAFHELQPLLEKALAQETKDDTAHEMAVTARGLAKAAEILAGQFTLVATNVPYLGRGKQDDVLEDYCDRVHPEAKADLATCFVERCLDFCAQGASTILVTPQNWLFLSSYTSLRKRLLKQSCWNFLAKLGPNAFQDMNWWAAITLLVVLTRREPPKDHQIHGCDVGGGKDQGEKASLLTEGSLKSVSQASQLISPKHAITFEDLSGRALLCHTARSVEGLSTGDGDHFLRKAWEFPRLLDGWEFFHVTPDEIVHFGGLSEVILWEQGTGDLSRSEAARLQGYYAWGKKGVLVSKMNRLKCCLYFGVKHDKMSAAIISENEGFVGALWAFCSSEDYHNAVRLVSQKVDVATNTLVQVPFDLPHWQEVAAEKYLHGLPKPFSSDPTQWLFNGHPKGAGKTEKSDTLPQPSPQSGEGVALHVAVARLLGYQWPRQTGASFSDCPPLGPDGLEKLADDDGIVCLTPLHGEASAADRLRSLLAVAFGSEWSPAKERELIAAMDSKETNLEGWLQEDFFIQHVGLFHQRPFIWHIWDGLQEGFHALVNYHQLAASNGGGRLCLESLTYSYLGDWITRQRDAVAHNESGSDDRLAGALELQEQLKKILAGEPPYDLFVRWKPLHQQPIGWEPDINDGVRLNIRPFMLATLSHGKKGAGLLHAKPNIKWEKDRGKEPSRPKEDFPWFWGWDQHTANFTGNNDFDGNRWNDCHYTTEFKRAARTRQAAAETRKEHQK